MSQMTVIAGVKELRGDPRQGTDEMARRQRRCGGGRKALTSKHLRLFEPSKRSLILAPVETPWPL